MLARTCDTSHKRQSKKHKKNTYKYQQRTKKQTDKQNKTKKQKKQQQSNKTENRSVKLGGIHNDLFILRLKSIFRFMFLK